jgi:hypothetical protein
MAEESKRTISDAVLALEIRILVMERIDLYNKSRICREVQVRFCESLRGKFPLPTRRREKLCVSLSYP